MMYIIPVLFLFILSGCEVGDPGSPPKSSQAALVLQDIKDVQNQSKEIEVLAYQLESWVDEARRKVAAGESKEEQIPKTQQLMKEIEQKNIVLQKKIEQLEQSLQKK